MLQLGWTSQTSCQMKETRPKRPHTVWSYLYKVSYSKRQFYRDRKQINGFLRLKVKVDINCKLLFSYHCSIKETFSPHLSPGPGSWESILLLGQRPLSGWSSCVTCLWGWLTASCFPWITWGNLGCEAGGIQRKSHLILCFEPASWLWIVKNAIG